MGQPMAHHTSSPNFKPIYITRPKTLHLSQTHKTSFLNPSSLDKAAEMGGGQKRGRTQRRHFKNNRDNVWKYSNDSNPPKDSDAGAADGTAETNPTWQPFATQNPGFEEYYKGQAIVSEDEWVDFISTLRKPLPAAFRINACGQFCEDIRLQLENDFSKCLEAEVNNDDNHNEHNAIRPLPWYPRNLAWHLNFSRMELRKNQALERFHEFLKQENEVGNITRQEAVSMVPPLFLNVLPEHHVLDMCAAPGSKTFQLLEIIHNSSQLSELPKGLVIANDVDVQRCNLLIHQTKRMSTANLIVTNHEAQHFPSIHTKTGEEEVEGEEGQVAKSQWLLDRVLCDVPCSGDGTLRKAPDIWRKWNSGLGNGLHCLQVVIAMRGLALLKVGGRMVYSTCSMNPIENEAVVAEILRRCDGSVELLDVSSELPGLVRRPGLTTWKVKDRGSWFTSYKQVPIKRKGSVVQSMFPSGRSGKEETGIPIPEQEEETRIPNPEEETGIEIMESSGFPLERCMRIVPHDQNSGAFFIAVFQKLSNLPAIHANIKPSRHRQRKSPQISTDLEAEKTEPNEIIPEEKTEPIEIIPEEKPEPMEIIPEEKPEPNEPITNNEKNEGEISKNAEKKVNKWRGVDPVVFFSDEKIIDNIISFYGISDDFPIKGNLVARNDDCASVKRIYYVSDSVREVLKLNLQVGQKLKITSLGLKIFERQSAREEAGCTYRISSEGLQLLVPHITKQILLVSCTDFSNLLKDRVVQLVDFVDPTFGERASALRSGCCVAVLREGDGEGKAVDGSAIAMVCWKGKSNLTIMVSPLDAKELLERLQTRYGTKSNEETKSNEKSDELVIVT